MIKVPTYSTFLFRKSYTETPLFVISLSFFISFSLFPTWGSLSVCGCEEGETENNNNNNLAFGDGT